MAAPVTYMIDDVQYVSVMAGWGGAFAKRARTEGKIYTFTLGGKEKLPTRGEPPEVEPIPQSASQETIAKGADLFRFHCARCHGGGTTLTDLRYSLEDTYDLYTDILLEGVLADIGMRSYAARLTEEEVQAIRAFVVEERNKVASKSN